MIPALPKELVVNPKLEEFNHPEHSDSLHHRDHATHDIIRTHSSETLPGFPPEVAKGKKFAFIVMFRRRRRPTGKPMAKQSCQGK